MLKWILTSEFSIMSTSSTSLGSTPPSTPEAWNALLGQILGITACRTGTIHRIDPANGLLAMIAHIGIPEVLMDKISLIPVGKGIAGAAAQRREPVQFCNIQDDPTGVVRPDARKTNVQGAVAVPILAGDRLLGVLGVGKMEVHDFTPAEIETVQALAAQLVSWV